jgi:hypothetical protein
VTVAAAALLAALLGDAGEARAVTPAGPTVVLLQPATSPRAVAGALVRVRGELSAEGFEVVVVTESIGPDVRGSLERSAPARDAVATVAVVAGADLGTTEVWVVDRVTGKTVVRRVSVQVDSPRASEVLAVRAVELLRASFLELAIGEERRPPPGPATATLPATPPVVRRWVAEELEPTRRWDWGFELGGVVVGSFEHLGPAFLPMVRVEAAYRGRYVARLSGAGFGPPAEVTLPSSAGRAEVSQQLALAEGAIVFRAGRRFQPMLTLGAGALHFAADGIVTSQYTGRSNARWAFAASAGAGVRLHLHRRFELAIEASAIGAWPYPVVRFFDTDAARAGRPSLMAGLTLIGWLL